MQLSTFSDYSMRVMIYLGLKHGELVTIAEIARAYQISENHLMKVVHHLGQRGYIETLRGKGGGLRLAGDAASVNLGELLRATEGCDGLLRCMDEPGQCCIQSECRLIGILHEAQEALFGVLGKYTLADLLIEEAPLARLLIPAKAPVVSIRAE
jgi:Rrf2 family nitric oxide-sensitive transcriptional repressor